MRYVLLAPSQGDTGWRQRPGKQRLRLARRDDLGQSQNHCQGVAPGHRPVALCAQKTGQRVSHRHPPQPHAEVVLAAVGKTADTACSQVQQALGARAR